MKNGLIITIALAIWGLIKLVAKILRTIVKVLTDLIIYLGLYIPLFYLLFGVILLAATDFTFGGMGTNQLLYFIGLGLSCAASLIITIRTVIVRPISHVFAPLADLIRDMKEKKAERRAAEEAEEAREAASDRPYDRFEESYPAPRRMPRDPYYDPYGRAANRYYDEPRPYAPPREEYGARPSYYEEEGDPRSAYYPDYPAEEGEASPRSYESSERGMPERREPAYYPRFDEYRRAPEPEAERPLVYYSRRRPGVLVKEYSDRFELYEERVDGRRLIGTEYKDE